MLKKYTDDVEHQRFQRQAEKDEMRDGDIPFGSRAIESGIMIEGIWICNSTCPSPVHNNLLLQRSANVHVC